jgi:short-subunit dehydrogenase
VIPIDLSDDTSYDVLNRILIEAKPEIKILINNAGLDINGRFDAMEVGDIINMVNINIKGMTVVNRLCFPYMKKGSFAIITGSVSSFVPVPSQAVYSSSKVYVKFLTRALREEVKEKGINVCLLCPGNIDTEMNIRSEAKMQKTKVSRLPYLDMKKLTVKALQKAESGKSVYTPGTFYKIYRLLGKVFPTSFMMKLTKNFFSAN